MFYLHYSVGSIIYHIATVSLYNSQRNGCASGGQLRAAAACLLKMDSRYETPCGSCSAA